MSDINPTLYTVIEKIQELRDYLEQRLGGLEEELTRMSAKMDLIHEDLRKLRSDYAELADSRERVDDDAPDGPVN